MTSRIDRDLVLKTLRGYAEVNAITDAERRARLEKMTSERSWTAFESLYQSWRRTGQQAGGDWEALAQRRLEESIALRRAFEALARSKGLI